MATISGKWIFNENLTRPTFKFESIHFSVGDVVGFRVNEYDDGWSFYAVRSNGSTGHPFYANRDYGIYWEWGGEDYRTVDFGTTPQEVSEEFYNWFTENATQLSQIIYGEEKIFFYDGQTINLKCAEKVFLNDIIIANNSANDGLMYILYNGQQINGFGAGKKYRLKCAGKKAKGDISILLN